MNIVIIITLVYMIALFVAIIVWLTNCSKDERLNRLKDFKRGKFVFIYFAVFPLFFLANRFNGENIEGAIWLSIHDCFSVAVLQFDYATVYPLLTENLLYHIALEILFSLVVLNAIIFTLSFCWQWLYNRISLFFLRRSRKNAVVVIGTNSNALNILESVPKGYKAVLIGNVTREIKDEAYLRKAGYISLKKDDDLGRIFSKLFRNFKNRKISAIMNLENDENSLIYVNQLLAIIKTEDLSKLPLTKNVGLSVYIFAENTNAEIFSHYVEESNGILRFINRHKQISIDFIDRYPLTQFMTEREIDYSTATIREEIDLNIFMIGFGKLNENLFLASVSNNQFLTLNDGIMKPKPVNYHIYDRYYPQGKFTEKKEPYSVNLHHNYSRYKEFLDYYTNQKHEFLEFVVPPANVINHPLEINHPKFYSSLRPVLMKNNTYNYIIISFGTDMENIELAKKLQQKLNEWMVKSPVKIFVKVRDAKVTKSLKENFQNIIFFGANAECVYNAEIILREKIEQMSRFRHILYSAEDQAKKDNHSNSEILNDTSLQEEARKKWYSFKEYQRESNIYACLSARMKLQLCGFDYSTEGEDCSTDFIRAYEKNDKRVPSDLKVMDKSIWRYSNADQFRNSIRWTLAKQEHLRWCANMITNGFVPCSKTEILTKDKKELLNMRKHGNITTMKGLVEYREMLAQKMGKSTEETDVIRYDYQLMDDIEWLLQQCEYKIIKK